MPTTCLKPYPLNPVPMDKMVLLALLFRKFPAESLGNALPQSEINPPSSFADPATPEFADILKRARDKIVVNSRQRNAARGIVLQLQRVVVRAESTFDGDVEFHLVARCSNGLIYTVPKIS